MSHEWYADAAEHYERGRLPYPAALESLFEAAVGRGGRLLDAGCGPGTVGLRLAALYDDLVGVDRDAGMVAYARSRAAAMGLEAARFIHASVEDLPDDLGTFRVVIVAQAFHWFDGRPAARAMLRLLEPGGHCVVLYAWSLTGDPASDVALPAPPYAAMDALGERLGGHRAGPPMTAPHDESGPMAAAGFEGPESWQVPGGEVIVSSADDLIAPLAVTQRRRGVPHRTAPGGVRRRRREDSPQCFRDHQLRRETPRCQVQRLDEAQLTARRPPDLPRFVCV